MRGEADTWSALSAQCNVLASAMAARRAFMTLRAAGVDEHLFDAPGRQSIWVELAKHYESHNEPPPPDAIRLALGRHADSMTEVECAHPYSADDLQFVADQLLTDRQVRSRNATVKQARVALDRNDVGAARKLLDQVDEIEARIGDASNVIALRRSGSQLLFKATADIFAPLSPTRWVVPGLQLGPGRPALLAGYGASAKTLAAQSMALAVAAGKPVWGFFESVAGVVRHVDYEQGWKATARRYQRLASGHDIDRDDLGDRLQLCSMPRVFLDEPAAIEAYARAGDGASLVIIDALRGATPRSDENDSSIRAGLDVLTAASERTGAAYLVIHHAGKPRDGHSDDRTVARGSSAIFDAAGLALLVTAGKSGADPKRVRSTKTPAEAEGAPVPEFELIVEDVPGSMSCAAGVRVMYRAITREAPDAVTKRKDELDRARLLQAVNEVPGAPTEAIRTKAGINKQRAIGLLAVLAHEGSVRMVSGPRGAKNYWPVST